MAAVSEAADSVAFTSATIATPQLRIFLDTQGIEDLTRYSNDIQMMFVWMYKNGPTLSRVLPSL